jgi:3-oxoacyl-[acyl-carrier-protein] synthase II
VTSTRIWMTGAGLVTALGHSAEATWSALLRGDRGIGPIDLFNTTGLRATTAMQVRGVTLASVRPQGGTGPEARAAWSRTSLLAGVAAREALARAKLDARTRRVGLVVGGTTGGMYENESLLAKLHVEPHAKQALIDMISHPLTATGDRLSETMGPFARVRTLCSACSSGANALIVAALWLLEGEVDAVLAGGTDGLCRLTFSGFNGLQAIDPEPCRPFDRRRRGLNLGEGAGFAVLERASAAEARGRAPMAELAGWALAAEAHHITNPEPGGATAARVIAAALARGGVTPAQVDYVNAHGTATPLNDSMESAALARALGGEVARVPVSSSKAQLGHTLGAAGAVEAIIAALAVEHQKLPPTAGLDEPDPACALVHVPHVGRGARVRAALSNSFGFGGMDSVLLFTEPGLGPGHDAGARMGRSVVVTGVATLTPAGVGTASSAHRLLESDASLPSARGGGLTVDMSKELDAARARRFDRPARLGAVVAAHALGEAAKGGAALDTLRVGSVLGSAFGSVDASAAFMHRLFEKGLRMASPADFPNLVPSSPVGHVSIYLGVHGPALATADLAASGESAVEQAAELVACGEADAVVAGSVEEASEIVERILVVLFARTRAEVDRPRSEGAGVVVLEAEESARARGAKVLARLVQRLSWRDGQLDAQAAPLSALAAPRDPRRARVVLPRDNGGVDALLAGTAWLGLPRATCTAHAGEHEGLGGIAIAAAASLVAEGEASEVLVVGLAKGRGYAIVLAAP